MLRSLRRPRYRSPDQHTHFRYFRRTNKAVHDNPPRWKRRLPQWTTRHPTTVLLKPTKILPPRTCDGPILTVRPLHWTTAQGFARGYLAHLPFINSLYAWVLLDILASPDEHMERRARRFRFVSR